MHTMGAKSRWTGLVLIALTLALGACGQEGGDGEGESRRRQSQGADFSPVMARVGDIELTRAYFDYRYEHLSPQDKSRFSGEDWEKRFLKHLVEESLVYRQAEEEKLDLQRETEYRLDMARRSILYKAYYEANFGDTIEVPEDRIVEYYEAAQKQNTYKTLGRAMAYHIQCSTKEKIDEAWAKLQSGTPFPRVAMDYSEDETTKANDGLLGYFNRDGYVLGMGFNNDFTRYCFTLKAHSLNPPKKIGDDWHIVKMGAKTEDELQSLENVRDRIVAVLKPTVAREKYLERLKTLGDTWDVTYLGEWDERDPRTAEQLYRLAAESRNSHAKLAYYQTVVDQYPDNELADEALFMVGFVASEEFGDVPQATAAFRRLKQDYPNSEFVDEADFMMMNLGRVEPELRGEQFPEDANEVNSRIEKLRH